MKTVLHILTRIQWYLLILLVLLNASIWTLAWLSSPISNDATPVMITVRSGASGHEIAAQLKRAGLIRSRTAFLYTVGLRREGVQLRSGKYELRRNMPMPRIIRVLVHGETAASWITVPEGYTVRQIAYLLYRNGVVKEKEFLDLALHGAAKFRDVVVVPSDSLEGYLFPDTYLFAPNEKPEAVIRQMLEVFDKRISGRLAGEIQLASLPIPWNGNHNRKLYDTLTLASLIEREARKDKDRALISSVLHNRLRKGMRLQIDATVQYAMGEHRPRLYWRDYKTESPYNTYLHGGLPPGPIANPGLASIEAALRPAESDYLYYVAGPDGFHVFSATLAEHDRAIARVRSNTTNNQ